MSLEKRLADALAGHKAEGKRMFSGTGFMVNGNLAVGTHKGGLIVRVGKDAAVAAAKRPGASAMEMGGRKMLGWIIVEGSAVTADRDLRTWLDLALAFNKTLPAKAVKPARPRKKAKSSR